MDDARNLELTIILCIYCCSCHGLDNLGDFKFAILLHYRSLLGDGSVLFALWLRVLYNLLLLLSSSGLNIAKDLLVVLNVADVGVRNIVLEAHEPRLQVVALEAVIMQEEECIDGPSVVSLNQY